MSGLVSKIQSSKRNDVMNLSFIMQVKMRCVKFVNLFLTSNLFSIICLQYIIIDICFKQNISSKFSVAALYESAQCSVCTGYIFRPLFINIEYLYTLTVLICLGYLQLVFIFLP